MENYKPQNLSDLRFALFEDDQLPRDIRVIKDRKIETENYSLDLQIIGSSHAITFQTEADRLTECLACIKNFNDSEDLVSIFPLRRSSVRFGTSIGFVNYNIQIETYFVEEKELKDLHQTLSDRDENSIYFFFPDRQPILESLTHLKFDCSEKIAQIVSYHTYPDQLAIIQTVSQFELRT